MNQEGPFNLQTEFIGALPIINHFTDRLKLVSTLERYLTTANKRKVSPALCIGILLRNVMVERKPVYSLQEWISRYHPTLLGITPEQRKHINDDRLGRSLDLLYDTDRASLMTEVVVRTIKEFDLDLSQFHNDSTSIKLSGLYKNADGRMKRGKKSLKAARGYSKDHRPDLKQLMWFLTVTADGAVPVHYKACDGNTGESKTHIETWNILRQLANGPDFLYVADSKLCSVGNMMHIHDNHGRFITVVPRNRREDGWFRKHIQTENVQWMEVEREVLNGYDDQPNIWRMVEAPMPSSEGFRIAWVWNTLMAERDKDARHGLMSTAIRNLEKLDKRLQGPRNKLRSRDAVIEAADSALGERARRWLEYEISEEEKRSFRQEKRGRPSPNTKYHRVVKKKFRVRWRTIRENVEYDARSDGMFPLITNCEALSLKDILAKYKYQPKLEKRHEQLKTVYNVAPILLKSVTRVEGLLFVYFLALLVQALVEREVRKNMVREGMKTLSKYPENRNCDAPTASRIMEIFELVQLNRLWSKGALVQVFQTELSDLQKEVLSLAGVPINKYLHIG